MWYQGRNLLTGVTSFVSSLEAPIRPLLTDRMEGTFNFSSSMVVCNQEENSLFKWERVGHLFESILRAREETHLCLIFPFASGVSKPRYHSFWELSPRLGWGWVPLECHLCWDGPPLASFSSPRLFTSHLSRENVSWFHIFKVQLRKFHSVFKDVISFDLHNPPRWLD